MIDYGKELGKTMLNDLRIIGELENPISRDEFAEKMQLSKRMASDRLQTLWKLGYIMDYRGEWKNGKGEEVFSPQSEWMISSLGQNYLELRRSWWQRFWVRSIVCPITVAFIISFITSLNANNIWKSIITLVEKASQ